MPSKKVQNYNEFKKKTYMLYIVVIKLSSTSLFHPYKQFFQPYISYNVNLYILFGFVIEAIEDLK